MFSDLMKCFELNIDEVVVVGDDMLDMGMYKYVLVKIVVVDVYFYVVK